MSAADLASFGVCYAHPEMKPLLILLCGLLTGCVTPYSQPKTALALTSVEADVYEAVFRHQFARNGSGAQQTAGTYFIQIRGADPSQSFLLRFFDHTPAVKPASQARLRRGSVVYDPRTRRESLVFKVGAIRWHGKNPAEVDGGYYEAKLSASGNIYRLIRKRTKWNVIEDTMHVISDAMTIPADGRNAEPVTPADSREPGTLVSAERLSSAPAGS